MKTLTKNQIVSLLAGITLTTGITALAPSAQAAQLISNFTSSVDGSYEGFPDAANSFTTGNVGLNIDSIDISWFSGNSGTAPQVGIFTDDSGMPSTTQVSSYFTNGISISSGGGTQTYSGAATLLPNTTYWIAIDILDGSTLAFSLSQTPSINPITQGASIPSDSAFGNISTGTWLADPASLIFAVNGTVVQPPVTTPEPGSVLALGVIGGGLLLRKRVKS